MKDLKHYHPLIMIGILFILLGLANKVQGQQVGYLYFNNQIPYDWYNNFFSYNSNLSSLNFQLGNNNFSQLYLINSTLFNDFNSSLPYYLPYYYNNIFSYPFLPARNQKEKTSVAEVEEEIAEVEEEVDEIEEENRWSWRNDSQPWSLRNYYTYTLQSGCCSSTGMKCTSDSDCRRDGCSGQICTSIDDGIYRTTCEWRECYGLCGECRCIDNRCIFVNE